MQEAIDKFDDHVLNKAEQALVDALEVCDVELNQVFIEDALRSALIGLLALILSDSSDNEKSFGDAIIQVATAPKSLASTALADARDTTAIKPTAWNATKIVKQKVKDSVKNLVFPPQSHPKLGLYSSYDEARKNHKDRRFKGKSSRRSLSVFPSNKSTKSLKRSVRETTKTS